MLYDKRWDATVVQPLLPEQQSLLDAADLLEKDGWCQGQFEDINGRHCAMGAIIAVQGKGPGFTVDDVLLGSAGYLARQRLEAVLPIKHVPTWNAAPGRTLAEVVAALREAAKS